MTTYRNASRALVELSSLLTHEGTEVGSRLGERTLELLGQHVTLTHPTERYITAEGRRVNLAAQIAETMWVLAGRNDIEWLSHYLPRAPEFSDDGETWRGAYGPRLRRWPALQEKWGNGGVVFGVRHIDQLDHVVRLLQEDRGTRRAVMSIYNPAIDTEPGKDIPCNDFIQFISREGQLHAYVFVRSNDLWWGWSGINQFEWSVLQEIVAGMVGAQVGTLTFSITSLHLYDRHWKRAREVLLSRHNMSMGGKRFSVKSLVGGPNVKALDDLITRWFDIEAKIREEILKRGGRRTVSHATWVRIINFPDPMLREWLMVLAYYWSNNEEYLYRVSESVRAVALRSPRPKKQEEPQGFKMHATEEDSFLDEVAALHRQKHEAYGDSWKKRGELLSILPNIARKVDRLEGGVTDDETAADTAIDLMVYLAKYRTWLLEETGQFGEEYHLSNVEATLRLVPKGDYRLLKNSALRDVIAREFNALADARAEDKRSGDRLAVLDNILIPAAYVLAHRMWEDAQSVNTEAANDLPQPHSRACGVRPHPHGQFCAADCPTCHGGKK